MKTPLQIAIYFHPKSDGAMLASKLYRYIAGSADDTGLRIPVRFHSSSDGRPLDVQLDSADHTLVVALVDRGMTRRVGPGAPCESWEQTLQALATRLPQGQGPHALLPVAIDDSAFSLDEAQWGLTSMVRLDVVNADERSERLLFHVVSASLQLLRGWPATAGQTTRAPIQVFVSHAKRDLPRDFSAGTDDDPVRALLAELAQGPVDAWYDAKRIPRGGRFDHEIQQGVLDASAMIVVLTNDWSNREWCRREVLEAKEARRPILVLDHITDEKPRLFPYLGNAPVMRWRDRRSARKAVTFAVREALRYQFYVEVLERSKEDGDVVFGVKPELLSVAQLPKNTRRVLYPDPPLGDEEMREIRRVATALEFATPLTMLMNHVPQPSRIALSLSGAADSAKYGGSSEHLRDLAHDLNLFLFWCGFTVAYGGKLGGDGISDEVNFMESMFSVARSYSEVARQAGRPVKPVIVNYVSWPIHLMYGPEEHGHYQRLALLECCQRPSALHLSDADLGVSKDKWFPPNTLARRLAWAEGLTAMRENMRDAPDIAARIVVGGKLSNYQGRYAGVIEEALIDLRAGRPVYLVGCLGGAARLVYDTLQGEDRVELTTDWVRGHDNGEPRVRDYDQFFEYCHAQGKPLDTPEVLREELQRMGRGGLATALNNGLDDSDNAELANSAHPQEVVRLIIKGLSRIAANKGNVGGPETAH